MSGVDLLALAAKVEASAGADNVLNRAVARAVGWGYQTPSKCGRRHPRWFHPDDCRDGEPVLDSLHGTDVWREPLQYLTSLDAAMTLVPEGHVFTVADWWCWDDVADGRKPHYADCSDLAGLHAGSGLTHEAWANSKPLALVSAALRARHQSAAGEGENDA